LEGILVEPSKSNFFKVKRNYCSEKQLFFENSAISEKNEKGNFSV